MQTPKLDNPYLENLGVRLDAWQPGHVVMSLLTDESHANRTGVVQGGIVATVLDAAAGYAGLMSEEGEPGHAATISLAINYVAPARLGALRVEARITGGGRKVYFSEAKVFDAGGNLVATAQGSFRRYGGQRPA
ncbi:PaaI family thioesterase [Verticiella sediminum]|uniref:Medium/long-chain acyl-CoA thioesterase YigI n=1 Tax=Verticiella sediminum TaxID=1247510 RepID=A0A556AW60_9BURK|nr:PaaI family thioesterase [Verticiella sediminum]TSH97160.1 PaaI family thioesterase [Verticiella sediminum]